MRILAPKIPPPLYFFVIGLGIYCLHIYIPIYIFIDKPYHYFGIVIFMLGGLFGLYLVYLFHRNHTTTNPINLTNTSSLLTVGIYSYSRNPMYLGLLLMMLGEVIYLRELSGFFGIMIFYYCITYFQILPEEYFLEAQFGDEYTDYKKRTRRWL